MSKIGDITKKLKKQLDDQEVEVDLDPKFSPKKNEETGEVEEVKMKSVNELVVGFNRPFSYAYLTFLEGLTQNEQAVYLTDLEKGVRAFRSYIGNLSDQELRELINSSK